MIPTYRPDERYLRQAIESVLQQAPGPEQMQIEVVDDCSPEWDVATMVKSVAGARILISQTPRNLGLAACWNTCIERSRGEWVHIFHQDDLLLPGFYKMLAQKAEQHPEVALLATRSFFVDKDSVITGITPRLREMENGARAVEEFFYCTPIQCPGVVVRRSFYETHGGFRTDLGFVLDCEMWSRVISLAGGLLTTEALSCYRMSQMNETGRLSRTAENLEDVGRLNKLFAERYAAFELKKATEIVCNMALSQAEIFSKSGDSVAAKANSDFLKRNASVSWRLRRSLRKIARLLLK